jgi:hypothetical protein
LRFIFLFCLLGVAAEAQHTYGLRVGIPVIPERLPAGNLYLPFQVTGLWEFRDLLPKRVASLHVFVEPQAVWSHFSPPLKTELEAGINAGLSWQWPLSPSTRITGSLSTGPHFITCNTSLQSRGFNFSDNFAVGIRHIKPHRPMGFEIAWRFRHISNGGITNPNLGIDTWFITLGVFWVKPKVQDNNGRHTSVL